MSLSTKPFCSGTNNRGEPCKKRANYPSNYALQRGLSIQNTRCLWHVDQAPDHGVATEDCAMAETDEKEVSGTEDNHTAVRDRPGRATRSRSISFGEVEDGIEARVTITPRRRSGSTAPPAPATTPTPRSSSRSRRGSLSFYPPGTNEDRLRFMQDLAADIQRMQNLVLSLFIARYMVMGLGLPFTF